MLLHERLAPCRLLLASQSPRRRELLTGAGIPFTAAPRYACAEVWPEGLAPGRVAGYLARLKSRAYPFELQPRDILLTADTVVIAGGRILGKPSSQEEAADMLRLLSGARHEVVTGVALRGLGRARSFSVRTSVWFRPLSEEQIAYYISSFRPLDKAGAYGIQEWIGHVGVERIAGSFFNVMGLPVQRLCTELEGFVEE